VSSDIKHDILEAVQDLDDFLYSYHDLLSGANELDPNTTEIAAFGAILMHFTMVWKVFFCSLQKN
jgi:hypothetical protein